MERFEIWYLLSKYNNLTCSYDDKKVEVKPYESYISISVYHSRGAYFSAYAWDNDGAFGIVKHLIAAAKGV